MTSAYGQDALMLAALFSVSRLVDLRQGMFIAGMSITAASVITRVWMTGPSTPEYQRRARTIGLFVGPSFLVAWLVLLLYVA